jgi:hypothetical protein
MHALQQEHMCCWHTRTCSRHDNDVLGFCNLLRDAIEVKRFECWRRGRGSISSSFVATKQRLTEHGQVLHADWWCGDGVVAGSRELYDLWCTVVLLVDAALNVGVGAAGGMVSRGAYVGGVCV